MDDEPSPGPTTDYALYNPDNYKNEGATTTATTATATAATAGTGGGGDVNAGDGGGANIKSLLVHLIIWHQKSLKDQEKMNHLIGFLLEL